MSFIKNLLGRWVKTKNNWRHAHVDWLIFDMQFEIAKKVFIRLAFSKTIWRQRVGKDGNVWQYKLLCLDFEELETSTDRFRLYSLTIFGFIFSIGWI